MIRTTDQTSDSADIQVDNLFLGQCIGDAIFFAGSGGTESDSVSCLWLLIHHFVIY
jgi:hypothetical protein